MAFVSVLKRFIHKTADEKAPGDPTWYNIHIYSVELQRDLQSDTCPKKDNPVAGLGNKNRQLSVLQTRCSACEPVWLTNTSPGM